MGSKCTNEFQLRWDARRIDDTARPTKALSQIKGNSLTYRPTDEALNAQAEGSSPLATQKKESSARGLIQNVK